jgi:hypothetical protein
VAGGVIFFVDFPYSMEITHCNDFFSQKSYRTLGKRVKKHDKFLLILGTIGSSQQLDYPILSTI